MHVFVADVQPVNPKMAVAVMSVARSDLVFIDYFICFVIAEVDACTGVGLHSGGPLSRSVT